MIACTIANNKTVAHAMLLAKSLLRHQPNAKIVLCFLENKASRAVKRCRWFHRFVLAQDLGIDNFDTYMARFQDIQHPTAVKAMFLKWALKHYSKEEFFIYMDPEIYVVNPIKTMEALIRTNAVVLIPHHVEPSPPQEASREVGVLREGIFHPGLVGVRRSQDGLQFVEWWARVMKHSSYRDPHSGLFLDRKWLNCAPAFFQTAVLRDPGYLVAAWNVHEQSRQIIYKQDKYWVDKAHEPLCCFHFQNGDGLLDGCLKRFVPQTNAPVYRLKHEYDQQIKVLHRTVR